MDEDEYENEKNFNKVKFFLMFIIVPYCIYFYL